MNIKTDRILLIANNFPPVRGGSSVVYANLARHLGERVLILAPTLSYVDGLPLIGWREHDRKAGYPVMRLTLLRTVMQEGSIRQARSRLWLRLSDLAIRGRLTLVILWLILVHRVRRICVGELLASGWVIAFCRWIPFVRTIAYVHGEEITTEDSYDHGHARARAALLAADDIVVVSHFTQMAVRNLLDGDAATKRIALIENGVDTTRFRPIGRRTDLVATYGIDGFRVFVSVCRLLEKKGIDNAIRAFASASLARPGWRYIVVGTGPYETRLREIAVEEGVADKVVFAGEVIDDDLVAHYCLGDIFVMPNRELANGDTEGFGLVFLEANCCGLPVIAGGDGGSTDAVQDGVNGIVVNGASVPEITTAMVSLMDDPALLERLVRGAATISQRADWKGKTTAFLAVCAA